MSNRKKVIFILSGSVIVLLIVLGTILVKNQSRDLLEKEVKTKQSVPSDEGGALITDINTNKSRYSPGESVNIYVDLKNNTKTKINNGEVSLSFKHLTKDVNSSITKTYKLEPGDKTTLTFAWIPPNNDYQGYLVEAYVKNTKGNVLDSKTVGVDVSSNWLKFPRYGYLTQYGNSVDPYNITWQLKNYHINALQFYDWQWKHHMPIKGSVNHPELGWKELAGREVYKNTIENYIKASHDFGISAMEYNLIYGAADNYDKDGSGVKREWGLFDSPGGNQWSMAMPGGWTTSALHFFNPLNKDWQNYILNRELEAITTFKFDGWHADTVGDFGTKYDNNGNAISITTTFKEFLNYAKDRLGNKLLIMNAVGNKGHYDVNKSNVDAVYTEIWPWDGFPDYNSLKEVVDQARDESGGKSLIVPAYMNYDYSKTKSESSPGYFNTPGILLTDAAVFAAGGSRLEIGDDTKMLSSEYFPNRNLIMSEELKKRERNYYDFVVAYENLLRDGQTGTANKVFINGYASSKNGEGNKVWTFTKKDNNYEIIHLINLLGVQDTSWRDTNANKPVPTKRTNITVKYYYTDTINSVNFTSPDYDNCKSKSLFFTKGSDNDGNYIEFTVPSLEYWDMIYMSK